MDQLRHTALLFLDIDDVLCLNRRYTGYDALDALAGDHHAPDAVWEGIFERRACDALLAVHAQLGGQLRYVISSTWRWSFSREQLLEVFRRTGLPEVAGALHWAWRTPTGRTSSDRAQEIAAWLDWHHQGEALAIVDDDFSGFTLKLALGDATHPFAGRVVLCEVGEGLLESHVAPLVDALKRPVVSPTRQ